MLLPIPLATATLFGDPPTAGSFRDAALFAFLAGVVGAAGPFGIWLLRRSGAWRGAAIFIFVFLAVVALSYFMKSRDAPPDRPLGSIELERPQAA